MKIRENIHPKNFSEFFQKFPKIPTTPSADFPEKCSPPKMSSIKQNPSDRNSPRIDKVKMRHATDNAAAAATPHSGPPDSIPAEPLRHRRPSSNPKKRKKIILNAQLLIIQM